MTRPGPKKGYKGQKWAEDRKKRHKIIMKKYWADNPFTEEHKSSIGAANSISHKGQVCAEKTRMKIGAANSITMLGNTNCKGHVQTEEHKYNASIAMIKYCADNSEFGVNISITQKRRYADNPWLRERQSILSMGNTHWKNIKAEFCEELGHKVRSTWEKEVGFRLKELGVEYDYELKTYKVGKQSYTPDFVVNNLVIEVKGRINNLQLDKYSKFQKQYSHIRFIILCHKTNVEKLRSQGFIAYDYKGEEWHKELTDFMVT